MPYIHKPDDSQAPWRTEDIRAAQELVELLGSDYASPVYYTVVRSPLGIFVAEYIKNGTPIGEFNRYVSNELASSVIQ